MPDIVQPCEGHASVEHKLVFSGKRSVVFNPEQVTFVDAEIRDSVYTNGSSIHTFRTLDPAFLDSVKLAMAGADPVIEWRLGFGSPTSMFWLPWQHHTIVNYSARMEGTGTSAGHFIVFNTADSLLRNERSNKVVARKGTIAEIVRSIADENRLESVVEPTDGKFMLYQTFMDDTRFLRQRCLPRAITKDGHGGFYCYIRDNVLHFHTADYQGSVRQMDYYGVPGTELIVEDVSQSPDLWDSGLAGIRVIGHDPYTGQSQEISSIPDNAVRLSDHIYQYDKVTNGAWNVLRHLSANPPVEISALAQHGYQHARQKAFCLRSTLGKTISIRHGDLINVGIAQQGSTASSHSGYYYVTSAFHHVRKQAVTSSYTFERGEFRGSVQSLSARDAKHQLTPESKAPGRFPNILEVQSSEMTKGAGKSSSARTYAAVADANGKRLN